ncbi:MAG: TIGR03905 family TSCPD domain-containing protein [Rikenellaceae bacterium]
MKSYSFTPSSRVCCRHMEVAIDDNGIIEDAQFMGGCNGNLKGIKALIKGMSVEEVISRLEGIDCGGRGTSCPHELAMALKNIAK